MAGRLQKTPHIQQKMENKINSVFYFKPKYKSKQLKFKKKKV